MIWQQLRTAYITNEGLMIGKIRVATVSLSITQNGGWIAECHLPGISRKLAYTVHDTQQAARAAAERVTQAWLDHTGLKE